MAKGKSTFATWRCEKCSKPHKVTYYNKKNENVTKELKMFCNQCREHTLHKRKDTKKGSNK
ncbi:50S ribosomal protein L33 [Candidatus Peregrinibacteria bacterium]|nr:50S ribosomal protein L33 [Candidatus Peregrinibacteria bacterium]